MEINLKILKAADKTDCAEFSVKGQYITACLPIEKLHDYILNLKHSMDIIFESIFCVDEPGAFKLSVLISFKNSSKSMIIFSNLKRENLCIESFSKIFPASQLKESFMKELTGLDFVSGGQKYLPLLSSSYKGRKYPMNKYD